MKMSGCANIVPATVGLSGKGTSAGSPWGVVVTINGIWVPGGSAAIAFIPPEGDFIQIGILDGGGEGVLIGIEVEDGRICKHCETFWRKKTEQVHHLHLEF